MADEPNKDIAALLKKNDELAKQVETLQMTAARAESAETKLTELQTKTHNEKVAAHRAMVIALFEAPIKDKRIIPAVRETFRQVYAVDTDAVLKVSPEAVDLFIRANPNPDAPKAPISLGAVDPNDPAEKALFAAKQAAAAAALDPMNKDRPRDVLLVEAFKTQFRSSAELAKGWQSAPGEVGGAAR